jgi:hypothetical protein
LSPVMDFSPVRATPSHEGSDIHLAPGLALTLSVPFHGVSVFISRPDLRVVDELRLVRDHRD